MLQGKVAFHFKNLIKLLLNSNNKNAQTKQNFYPITRQFSPMTLTPQKTPPTIKFGTDLVGIVQEKFSQCKLSQGSFPGTSYLSVSVF